MLKDNKMAPKKKKLVEPIVMFPSQMEQAMTLLMQATVKNTEILSKVAEGIENLGQKFDGPAFTKDHQIDLDQENKMNPFEIKYIYQVEQRTQDLGDGIWDYENLAGKNFHQRDEAVKFGQDHYGVGMYRILQIEAPLSH